MPNFLNLKSKPIHLFLWVASTLSMVCQEMKFPPQTAATMIDASAAASTSSACSSQPPKGAFMFYFFSKFQLNVTQIIKGVLKNIDKICIEQFFNFIQILARFYSIFAKTPIIQILPGVFDKK